MPNATRLFVYISQRVRRSSNHLRLAYHHPVHTDVVLRILRFFRILRRAREVFTEVSFYFISLLVSDTSPQKFLCSLQGFFSKLPTSRITAVQSCCRSVKAHAALAVLDVPLVGQPQQSLYCTQTTPSKRMASGRSTIKVRTFPVILLMKIETSTLRQKRGLLQEWRVKKKLISQWSAWNRDKFGMDVLRSLRR